MFTPSIRQTPEIIPRIIAFLALSCLCLSCGGSNPPNGPNGDTTPPTVKMTIPTDGATSVSVDSAVTAVFSEPIDSMTITSASFALTGGVTGSFGFDGDTVRLTPAARLAYNTSFTATISTAVTDTAGNKLKTAYTWTFTTELDPATAPPTVVSTVPGRNAGDAVATDPIRVTFSKAMDSASITASSFTVDNGVTGTVTCSDKVATFTPSDTLAYSTLYTATITTAAADTFGNHLASAYQWSFTTQADPMIPLAYIVSPDDSAIVGDSVQIAIATSHPIGVTKVEFYVDGSHVTGADDFTEPFSFEWDASSAEIGIPHTIYAKAYDAANHVGTSDTLILYHRWQTLVDDPNDPWPTDIKRVLGRSTDSLLELRYEFWGSWADAFNDTSFDLGVYFDADEYSGTGRTDFAGTQLNGIGADYLMIVGVHGDTAFSSYNQSTGKWDYMFNPDGFAYLNIADSSDFFEVGIRWSDMLNTDRVRFVSINVLLVDQVGSFLADWAPDEGNGYVEMVHSNRYIGPPFVSPPAAPVVSVSKPSSFVPPNPFR